VSKNQTNLAPEAICLSCGFCCNGVIFADLKLQPGDDAKRLRSLGLPLVSRGLKLEQPCAAFCQGRCRIYPERPSYCRQFECALLMRLKSGKVTRVQALRTIRLARRSADEVFRLLHQLGDTDDQKPLATRFRQTTKRLERMDLDEQTAGLYGELTLAMQKLNCALSESFYPG
jgi:uncharacterized protein